MATNLTRLFKNIADAIRAKTGSSATIVAENFPAAIGEMWGTAALAPITAPSNTLASYALKTNANQFRAMVSIRGALLDTSAETVIDLVFVKPKDASAPSLNTKCTYKNGTFQDVAGAATLDTTTGTITLGGDLKFNAANYNILVT